MSYRNYKNPHKNAYHPVSAVHSSHSKCNNQEVNNYNTPHKNGYYDPASNFNNQTFNNSNTSQKNRYYHPAPECNNKELNNSNTPPKNGYNDPSTQAFTIVDNLHYTLTHTVIQPLNDILSSIGEQPINVPHLRAYGGLPNPFYRPDTPKACTTMCPMGKVHASDGSCRCVDKEDGGVPNNTVVRRPDNQQQCNIMCPRGHTLSTDGSCKCIRTCTNKCADGKVLATDGSCKCIADTHGMPSIEKQTQNLTDNINQMIENIGVGLSVISKHLSNRDRRFSGTYRNKVGGSRRSRMKKSKKTLRNRRS